MEEDFSNVNENVEDMHKWRLLRQSIANERLPKRQDNLNLFVRVKPFNSSKSNNKFDSNYDDSIIIVKPSESLKDEKVVIVNPNLFNASTHDIEKIATTLQLNDCANYFTFNKCFSNLNNEQFDIYESIGSKIAENTVVYGKSSCCFCYGASNSGKSFTVFGDLKNDESSHGLAPRVFKSIFETYPNANFFISIVEVYNDKVVDVLSTNCRDFMKSNEHQFLKIREHQALGPYIENINKVKISSLLDIFNVLKVGKETREFYIQCKNDAGIPSRGHLIITLEIVQKDIDLNALTKDSKGYKPIKICIVELASSDAKQNSKLKQEFASQESKQIRLSFATLSRILRNVCTNNMRIVSHKLPYRDSTLTYLLKDVLNERSFINVILNVACDKHSYEESLNSLRFGESLFEAANSSFLEKKETDTPSSIASPDVKILVGNISDNLASKYLLKETVTDPQQRIQKLLGFEKDPTSNNVSSSTKNISNPSSSINYIEDAYRALKGEYVELKIELESVKTDRDALALELRSTTENLDSLGKSRSRIDSRFSSDDIKSIKTSYDLEIKDLQSTLSRKDDTIDKLLSELSDCKNQMNQIEQFYKDDVDKCVAEIEKISKEKQLLIADIEKYKSQLIVSSNNQNHLTELLATKEKMFDELTENFLSQGKAITLLNSHHNALTNELDEFKLFKQNDDEIIHEQKLQIKQYLVDIEILQADRDSLKLLVEQQEIALRIQTEQADLSFKVLHDRQELLEKYEVKAVSSQEEFSRLQSLIQNVISKEGNEIQSELQEIKVLFESIALIREKLSVYENSLNESNKLKHENLKLKEFIEHQQSQSSDTIKKLNDENMSLQKLLQSCEISTNYWQGVAENLANSSGVDTNMLRNLIHASEVIDDKSLLQENLALQKELFQATVSAETARAELKKSQESMQQEFSALWNVVNDLNKLDADKEKEMKDMLESRNVAIRERDKAQSRLRQLTKAYRELQGELKSIDQELLSIAEEENIHVLKPEVVQRFKSAVAIKSDAEPKVKIDVTEKVLMKQIETLNEFLEEDKKRFNNKLLRSG